MASHCLSCPSFSFASLPTGRKLGVGPSLVGAQLACPPIRLYVPAAGAPCGDFPAAPSRSSAAAAAAEHGMALPESPAAPSLPAHQSGSGFAERRHALLELAPDPVERQRDAHALGGAAERHRLVGSDTLCACPPIRLCKLLASWGSLGRQRRRNGRTCLPEGAAPLQEETFHLGLCAAWLALGLPTNQALRA